MKDWSARFAEQLLKDNLRLEEFQVSLIGHEDLDEVVHHLRELGCQVSVDRTRKYLTVVCPKQSIETAC